jgi:hypothetical protein
MEKELKYIEKVDSIENESEYVKKCFTAMSMLAANPNIVRNTEDNNSPTLERNYILSMVYNMGKSDYLREVTTFDFGSGSCFVNGENNKHISIDNPRIIKDCKYFRTPIKKKGIEAIPDLVIHNSHNPEKGKTGEGQFLILEAKTTKRLNGYYFMRDFFKLNLYIAGLRFQNAVCLVINKPVSKIDDYIGTYKKKDYYWYDEVKSKLRLFIQETDTPKLYKLK